MCALVILANVLVYSFQIVLRSLCLLCLVDIALIGFWTWYLWYVSTLLPTETCMKHALILSFPKSSIDNNWRRCLFKECKNVPQLLLLREYILWCGCCAIQMGAWEQNNTCTFREFIREMFSLFVSHVQNSRAAAGTSHDPKMRLLDGQSPKALIILQRNTICSTVHMVLERAVDSLRALLVRILWRTPMHQTEWFDLIRPYAYLRCFAMLMSDVVDCAFVLRWNIRMAAAAN